jgi:predicted O-methyltransferase YrrM
VISRGCKLIHLNVIFFHLIIKIANIKNVLEIGTFTGLSALSILLALPDNGKLISLDKNEEN